MRYISRAWLTACVAMAGLATAPATLAGGSYENVARIVAVGDVHGDHEQFVRVLSEAGLIDHRGKWSGGTTHLVQLGDIPDRGPGSRKSMDLLMKLERQAKKAGGAVHALIGNHESMTMQHDLRYTHPGEYEAFATRGSARRRDRYYEATVASIKASTAPHQWPEFDQAHRAEWDQAHPLGAVELRQAWAPGGRYGAWVLSHNAVVRVNRTVFLHGGLSEAFMHMPISEINTRIRTELTTPLQLPENALVNAPEGPLWYRGLATLVEDAHNEAIVDRILAAYDAERIVIAHTPRLRAVVPRFNGKVLLADVGLSAHYGNGHAYVVIEGDEAYVMHRGKRLALLDSRESTLRYLQQVQALESDPAPAQRYIEAFLQSPAATSEQAVSAPPSTGS